MNTQLHCELGCPLSPHKIQINPVVTSAEACDFWHRAPQNHHVSLFTLKHRSNMLPKSYYEWKAHLDQIETSNVTRSG